jgi:hypothetical protein
MALLYGRARRLTAKNGGFRPGQRLFVQCANGEFAQAMITLQQMMQEGLNPSGAAVGALIEGHAPGDLHVAFKLLAAATKMPPECMPPQSALLTFLRQCEMQAIDRQVGLGRIVAFHRRSSSSYQIYEEIRCLYF